MASPRITASAAPVDVIGYLRVSTAEQADSGAGLAAQRLAIEGECDRRGWNLVAVYEDAGISGKAIANRPALDQALNALARLEASAMVIAKLDRLSRSLLDFAGLLERSSREGWRLLPLDLGIDLTTPAGEFMAAVMAAAAQWERRIISARTKDALAVRRSQGVRLGAPTSISADIETRIVRRYEAGATLRAIADELNGDGVPTSRGGAWQPSTLVRVTRRLGVPSRHRGPQPRNSGGVTAQWAARAVTPARVLRNPTPVRLKA